MQFIKNNVPKILTVAGIGLFTFSFLKLVFTIFGGGAYGQYFIKYGNGLQTNLTIITIGVILISIGILYSKKS